MYKERQLIDILKQTLSSGENICYFGIDLITEDYNPSKLAELAKKEGLTQRLGYLAEVCKEAAKVTHISEEKKLSSLYENLESSFDSWQHLTPTTPDWGKRLDMYEENKTYLNKKWKVYSPLRLEEIEDWIDLYVTKDYLHFTLIERYELNRQGKKYTRLRRNAKQ